MFVREEGLSRSPIFAMLSESLSGIATIRANHAVEYFQKKFRRVHDAHGMYPETLCITIILIRFHSTMWFSATSSINIM